MKRAIVTIIILAVIGVGGFWAKSKLFAAGPENKTTYKIGTVELGTVKKTISATGVLQPWAAIDIKSKAGGMVNSLLVDVGTRVKKGQRIALIDPADTQLQVD